MVLDDAQAIVQSAKAVKIRTEGGYGLHVLGEPKMAQHLLLELYGAAPAEARYKYRIRIRSAHANAQSVSDNKNEEIPSRGGKTPSLKVFNTSTPLFV